MVAVCPTITAYDTSQYRQQVNAVKGFADRLHIDSMDGEFAPTASPPLATVWWPPEMTTDIHLMYQRPMEHLKTLLDLKPNLVIIHNEAEVHHMQFAAELHKAGINAGLAILAETPISYAFQIMHSFDHVLIFSGKLGYHGGQADLGLLEKVAAVRDHAPDIEIGWDGGITDQIAPKLVAAGVDVLNVGSFIQKSPHPADAYVKLDLAIRG